MRGRRRPHARSWCTAGSPLLLLLLLAGCGETHVIPEGVLEIQNEWSSDGTIHAIEIEEVVGPNYLAFDVYAPPGDRIVVDVFPSLYDVTVHWVDGGLETFLDVEVLECCTTTVEASR